MLSCPEALADEILIRVGTGDLVMCLGAGTITNWAGSLPNELALKTGHPVEGDGA